jgi:hypothetical protein
LNNSKGRYEREECLIEVTELELQEKANAMDVEQEEEAVKEQGRQPL